MSNENSGEAEVIFADFEDVSPVERVERWANVLRVLEQMPQHEREKHWDMGTWGEKTRCGTVACAAGHCGLDPWFRAQGFRLDFRLVVPPNEHDEVGEWKEELPSVDDFFGTDGADWIFYNSDARPVETVIEEVRDYIKDLREESDL